jgi:penicillin-binding protein 1C
MSSTVSRRLIVAMAAAFLLAVTAPAGLKALVAWLPGPVIDNEASVLVVDAEGRLLRPFAIADGRWRLPVAIGDVDPLYVAMLLAYEDRRFPRHRGVDVNAFARAAWQMLRHGRIVSGGSTLTMQVARLLAGRSTRDAAGKLAQALNALALERDLGKNEILQIYLMRAPFGGNLEGVRAASLAYFGKEPRRLTPAQAALLVALPQSPEARRPDRDPEAARRARDRVLARAAAAGLISGAEAERASQEVVPALRRPFPMLAAHAAEEAVRRSPETPVHRLNIDAGLQARLEDLASARAGALPPGVSVAILAADHRTGEIVASVGSADYLDERRRGFIDMIQAVRSPGSTLKPLIYGLAFELGLAHPETLIEDRRVSFAGYAPGNFDGEHQGTVTVRRALQLSLNSPAVQVLDAVGPARLMARLRRAGATPHLAGLAPPGLAIGLGGLGLSLHDLVALYAAIARGGEAVDLAIGAERTVESRHAPARVLEARAAWQVAAILAGAPGPQRVSPGDVAFKTGTSFGYRDAWAVGFDGRHVIGVWVGRPDGAPVPGLVGLDAAAPILLDAFARLGRPQPLPAAPPGLLAASTSALPAPLQRFAHGRGGGAAAQSPPQIAFPPDGARVELGLEGRGDAALALKVASGTPPFTWFANGAPVAHSAFGREAFWQPDGRGFFEIVVVDGRRQAAQARVFLD